LKISGTSHRVFFRLNVPVPWGKHTPAKYRLSHDTPSAPHINKDWVLPIVAIRNPYTWFKSICKHNYMAKWDHDKKDGSQCPMLVKEDGSANPVTIKYGVNRSETHDSLAHVWNEWYKDYFLETQASSSSSSSDFPRLMIRMEDLVFYPKATTTAICECAGGTIRIDQPFSYAVDSAKPGKGHDHDHATGLLQAWIQYSQPYEPQAGFSKVDFELSRQWLDSHLMETFGYQHPSGNKHIEK
jgi:hypothetical protein